MDTYQIQRDPVWRVPLLVIAATAARSVAVLEKDHIDLRFGIAHVQIPYANIRDVYERDWAWWLGVGIRIAGDKTLGLIGSTRGVVQIALVEPTVEGVLFIRHPRNVAVSLSDPAGFIAAVRARMGR